MNSAPSIAMTNDDGRFEFQEISAGRYILRVAKTGFVSTLFDLGGVSNTYFDLRGGQRIDRGELRLPRAGVITGRVVDSYGDPASEIKVTAWRADYFGPGERRLASARSVDTNDLGEYRLFGLTPGKYYVSAAAQGVAPTFHPSTSNGLDAQPVFVKVNEDTPGTNIQMQVLQYTRVAGVVQDSSGRPARNVVVMVNPSRSDGAMYFSMNIAEADANGRFAIPAVPPGEYRVDVVAKAKLEGVATSGGIGDAWKVIAESASIPLTVTGERLEELTITLGAGARISGRVLIDGQPARPEVATKLQVAAFPVLHTQGISSSLQTVSGPVSPDGSFVVAGVHGSRLIRILGLPAATTALQGVIALGSDVSESGPGGRTERRDGCRDQTDNKPVARHWCRDRRIRQAGTKRRGDRVFGRRNPIGRTCRIVASHQRERLPLTATSASAGYPPEATLLWLWRRSSQAGGPIPTIFRRCAPSRLDSLSRTAKSVR
jgi:5-hydroxyisourate hydrolase-like protein (transthyretin family)